jgi:hypothetical protein
LLGEFRMSRKLLEQIVIHLTIKFASFFARSVEQSLRRCTLILVLSDYLIDWARDSFFAQNFLQTIPIDRWSVHSLSRG